MKNATALLLLAGLTFTANAAFAVTTDDVKWINQCVRDSQAWARRLPWC